MSSFKQKALFTAIAGASALGMSAASQAVYVNSDGLGQALVYPYYTTRAGTISLLSVVNTTDVPKAVKVRFIEGKNSAEVLDFNLFLSPRDVWTAAIAPAATGGGSAVVTNDKSCTNPKLGAGVPVAFRNFQYVQDGDVAALQTLDRTNEGYIEILEMATILTSSALAKDVTHVAGVPSCLLTNDTSFQASTGLVAPTGGLFGNVSYVNPTGGYSSSIDATAFDGWTTAVQATGSGSVTPSLSSGTSTVAVVNNNGNTYVSNFLSPRDAVSATIMHSQIHGEYTFTSDGTFDTDWVITMPTKRPYVNRPTVLPPFENIWDTTKGVSCDGVSILSTDREEFRATVQDDFSPRPPAARGNSFCYEANVIGFGQSGAASPVFGSTNSVGLAGVQNAGVTPVPVGREGGWATITFTNPNARLAAVSGSTIVTTGATPVTTAAIHTYAGLPVIGFASTSVVTATTRLNYSLNAGLRFNRSITP
jgi:hypothetical protein